MRRKQNEVLDNQAIDEIILKCECLRLGLIDEKSVYIVPVNFGFTNEDGVRTFYFHGSKEGKKKELILQNGYAGFEMDTNLRLVVEEEACKYTYAYQSVIGNGALVELTKEEEKIQALTILMKHYSDKEGFTYSKAVLDRLFIFKLVVEEISCKQNLK